MIEELKPLIKVLETMGIEYDQEMLDKFERYMRAILAWNEKVNLTAIRNEKEFVIKHYVDSVMCAAQISGSNFKNIIDIGTGAGFPGIPLAILFPEKNFVLLDSISKKINIVKEVAQETGIGNVTCIHGRAEDLGNAAEYREKFDFCVSRAVASLAVLSEYCLPLVKTGGYFAAYKGSDMDEELSGAERAIGILGGTIDSLQPFLLEEMEIGHQIIYIKKVGNTPKKYPRKAGKPLKEPI